MKTKSLKHYHLLLLFCLAFTVLQAQDVTVTVNAALNKKAVSPYIYGRNESFDKPVQFYKDAGLRFARVGGGNNMSGYNWRLKLTVHPDWFNNVYGTDWDVYAQKINTSFPNMQGMFAFQLLGRSASTGQHNFPDWNYMQAHPGWKGYHQNLAGGGTPDPNSDNKALVEGNIDLFSKPWPADSSVAILDHWFGAKGKGFNKNQFQYWSMDNEVDIWNGTHDWAMPTLITASAFMDRFIELAKKAKAIYPGIKICGPVTTSEWQWFKWGSESIRIDGKYYSWFEYFIKRCADEEKASGIRVLDVFDIHHYPYAPADSDALQNHRIFYDKNYVYPGANGLKTINGGWDNAQNKEYIFQRVNDWLAKHYGTNHGITLGLSEWSPGPNEPNLASVIYATHLGTFANNGVDYFTPWNWFTGMWETLHLYGRYAQKYSVSSTSSLENTLSAYTTVNENTDSMTVMIVNRDMTSPRTVTVNLSGFAAPDASVKTLQLASLPASETFKSHTSNALKTGSVAVASNSFTITVPKLSTTAVLLKSTVTGSAELSNQEQELQIFPNPVNDLLNIRLNSPAAAPTELRVLDLMGREIKRSVLPFDGHSLLSLDVSELAKGVYILSVKNDHVRITKKFTVAN
ncbi:MAG TPA: glycoside hydrolase family 44 protein [Prolixibacteraceae bacterium]|nr:glycoside hydrolase family 44 protein [Prolixibacteraceae bacterium]